MPDWRELVRKQLAWIQLTKGDAAQVAEELASHLERMRPWFWMAFRNRQRSGEYCDR